MSKNITQFTQAADISDTDKLVGHAGTASGAERGFLWSLIKSKLKTYFDTLYATVSHTHAQSDITNLTTDLAGKAASSHTHAQSDITNLTSDLAGKAASSHTHAQSDITNLTTDLAGKQPLAAVLTNTTASFTTAQETKLAGIEASADVTDAGNVGSAIHGAADKTTPVDADTLPLIDSEASNVLKKLTWANLKATLNTYLAGLYEPLRSTVSQAEAEAGTGTTVRAWTAERVKQAILALAPGGGGTTILGITGSTTPVIDNSATETSVAAFTIPGGTLGNGSADIVHVQYHGYVLNNTGAGRDFTFRVKLGATTLFDDATTASLLANSSVNRIVVIDLWLSGDGTTGTQRMWGVMRIGGATSPTAGYGDLGANGIMVSRTFGGTSSEDSTASKTLDLTVQLGGSASTSYEWTTLRAVCRHIQ